MPTNSGVSLAEYLQSVLDERQLSIRALATYAKISHSTVRRVLAGEIVDYPTLQALADYLNLPVVTVYRMAGLMPEEEESVASVVLAEIENMLRELPEASQKKIRDMIKLEWEYTRQEETEEESEQVQRKAS